MTEKCFQVYDGCLALMQRLNESPLRQFLAGGAANVDEADIIRRGIRMAADGSDLVYALGPHPLLIMRVIEAIVAIGDGRLQEQLRRVLLVSAEAVVHSSADPAFRWLWRIALAGCHATLRMGAFMPIDPMQVVYDTFNYKHAHGEPDAVMLKTYLASKGWIGEKTGVHDLADITFSEVLVALQRDTSVTNTIAYGSTRIAMEAVKQLKYRGCRVALAACGVNSVGMTEGLLYFSRDDESGVLKGIRKMGVLEAMIGVSRGDVIAVARAKRAMVYHHGPHPIQGLWSYRMLNRYNVPVVCLSQSSAREQVRFGLNERLASWVYSGFKPDTYRMDHTVARQERRLIFAGGLIDYKGVDIALKAFALIRDKYPEAGFHLCGSNTYDWRKAPECLLPTAWYGGGRGLDFDLIEREFPGVKYCGEKTSLELAAMFREASVLIMPSRVAETFGLVSIEAQACGCIPILPRKGAFPETLREGETGFLYEPNTPEALATEVIRLWDEERLTPSSRENAARFVHDSFSWERTGVGILAALDKARERSWLSNQVMYAAWFHDACISLHGSERGILGAALRGVWNRMSARMKSSFRQLWSRAS